MAVLWPSSSSVPLAEGSAWGWSSVPLDIKKHVKAIQFSLSHCEETEKNAVTSYSTVRQPSCINNIDHIFPQKFNHIPGEGEENSGKDKKITIKKVPGSPPAAPRGMLSVCPRCLRVGDMGLFSHLGSVLSCLSCVSVRHPKQTPGTRMLKMILLPHGPDTQANSFICGSTEEKAACFKPGVGGKGGKIWQSWIQLQDAVVASNLAAP